MYEETNLLIATGDGSSASFYRNVSPQPRDRRISLLKIQAPYSDVALLARSVYESMHFSYTIFGFLFFFFPSTSLPLGVLACYSWSSHRIQVDMQRSDRLGYLTQMSRIGTPIMALMASLVASGGLYWITEFWKDGVFQAKYEQKTSSFKASDRPV